MIRDISSKIYYFGGGYLLGLTIMLFAGAFTIVNFNETKEEEILSSNRKNIAISSRPSESKKATREEFFGSTSNSYNSFFWDFFQSNSYWYRGVFEPQSGHR